MILRASEMAAGFSMPSPEKSRYRHGGNPRFPLDQDPVASQGFDRLPSVKLPHEMNHTEVLVLNGSPGSGKTTLANAIGERLREIDTPHAVIDVDELARVHPEIGSSLGWKNLRAIWPNYTALPNLKVILPVCIDTKRDLDELRMQCLRVNSGSVSLWRTNWY